MTACPSHEALLGLAAGEEDPALEAHLEGCRKCRDAVSIAARLASTSLPSPPEPDELELAPGLQIGRYLIEATVGAGAYGQVLRARDTVLHRPVALKVFKAALSAGVEARVHQLREAQSIARLGHPAIAAVHEIMEHAGHSVIVMEWVEGVTLREWVRQPRPWAQVVAVLEKVARGLAAAHEARVVHGDLKPDNLLVRADHSVKIVDFGLARALESEQEPAARSPLSERGPDSGDLDTTTAGSARGGAGTPMYMTTPQLRGQPATPASDQHAFFVTAYEALCGRRPYPVRSIAQLLEVHRQPAAPLPHRLPRELRRLVRRGLSDGSGQGFPDMAAVADALDRVPGRRRLRLASSVAVLAAVALASLGLVKHHLDGLRPLVPAARAWGPGQRLALELAVGWPRASTMVRTLDERTAALTAMLRRPRVSAALAACVATAIDDLEVVARAIIERPDLAVDLITGVVESRDCDDDAEVQRQFGGPDAHQRAEVARMRRQLTRADLLLRQRHEPEALALLAHVAATASDPRLAWLRCDAELKAARTLANAQARDRAMAAYLRALQAAVLARDDKRRARVYVGMSYASGGTFGDPRLSALLADLAWSHVKAFPQAHDLRAQAARARGLAALSGRDFAGARPWLELALAEARLAWEDGFVSYAYLLALARLAITQGDVIEGERLAQQAVDVWRSTWGDGQPGEITVISHLASALVGRGRFDEALSLLRSNLALAQRALGPRHGQTLEAHIELAQLLVSLGRWHEGRDVACEPVELLGPIQREHSSNQVTLMVRCAHARWQLGDEPGAEALLRQLDLEHEGVPVRALGRLLLSQIAASHGQLSASRRLLHQVEDDGATLIGEAPTRAGMMADGWDRLGEPRRAACWRSWTVVAASPLITDETRQAWVDALRDSPACAEKQ